MKICPSCSARLGDDVSVCSSCEYRFSTGEEAADTGAKKTMMGLPALTDYRSMAQGTVSDKDDSLAPVRATLFGLPALNLADALSEPSEESMDATSMLSGEVLDEVLKGEIKPAAHDVSKMTAFGMRAPTMAEMEKGRYDAVEEDSVEVASFDENFGALPADGDSLRQRLSGAQASEVSAALRGWGLEEFSEDDAQVTQALGSDVLQRSGFGAGGASTEAIGFDAEDYSGAKHTIMGMAIDSEAVFSAQLEREAFSDETRSVNPSELFGSQEFLDAGGLPQTLLDKVRDETLARQTTSLNVPSISSTPASGLVRARSDSGQSLRPLMDTPVIYGGDVAEEKTVAEQGLLRKAPSSGVFKKLKRRLAEEAAENRTSDDVEGNLSGLGVYQMSADNDRTAVADPDLLAELSEPEAFVGSTLSSMAEELASIPSMSGGLAAVLESSDEIQAELERSGSAFESAFNQGESARDDISVVEAEAVSVEAEPEDVAALGREEVAEPEVAVAEVVQDVAAVASSSFSAGDNALEEKPQVAVAREAVKESSPESAESAGAKTGMNKIVLLVALVVLVILGLVVVLLLK